MVAQSPRSSPRRHRGFTLLEMMVVLVIIGLVAGLVGPRLFANVDASKVKTANVQIKLLRGAVETMRMDVGSYPTAEQGLDALVRAPSDARLRERWKGPYLDEELPLDPWNNPYQYRIPGGDGRPFAVVSLGADGQPGGEGNDADIGAGASAAPAGN